MSEYLTDRQRSHTAEEREKLFHALGIRWDRLTEGRSPGTIKAMGCDIALYIRWCNNQGVAPFPLPPESLALYVESLIDRGLKLTSVRRFVFSIRALHVVQEHAHPGADPAWPPLWKALVRRFEGTGALGGVQATPLTRQDFSRMVAACGSNRWGLRDKALLYVARDSLCKSSELAALRFEDIHSNDDLIGGYLRVPPVGASNAAERFDYRALSPATLGHVGAWCVVADIDSGYLFPAMSGRRRADTSPLTGGLGPQEIGRIIRRLAALAGLDHAYSLTSESLRVGGVQHLMAAGATLDQIRQAAGWKTYHGIQRQASWLPNGKATPWRKLGDDM